MRTAPRVALAPEERTLLERWASDPDGGARRARRSRIVLDAARGRSNAEIAADLATSPETVARWRSRFVVTGPEGLEREAPRAGDGRRISPTVVGRILELTSDPSAAPPGGWSTRALARALRVNHMLVHRVWKAHGLFDRRPPNAAGSLPGRTSVEVVGAFVTPRVRALVFLTRSRPEPLPFPGPSESNQVVVVDELLADPASRAHELVATVRRLERRRAASSRLPRDPGAFLVFLRALERAYPDAGRLDVVVDRRPERLGDRSIRWLSAHPRFRLVLPAADQSWSSATAGWLGRWDRSALDPQSLRLVPTVLRAFESRRRGGRPGSDPSSWRAAGPPSVAAPGARRRPRART